LRIAATRFGSVLTAELLAGTAFFDLVFGADLFFFGGMIWKL
jgi:hypothetical protein